MSRDMQFVKICDGEFVIDSEWFKAIDIDIIRREYESLMGEDFPLILLDYGDVLDFGSEEPRCRNHKEGLKNFLKENKIDIDYDVIISKLNVFVEKYNTEKTIEDYESLDEDCEKLLDDIVKKYIPDKFVFYWE